MEVYHSRIWGEIEFYKKIKNEPSILIEGFENYQKRSSRNRYKILTSQGIQTLSIPLKKGKNNQTLIQHVSISYDDLWVNKHLNALKTAYHKAPYFEHYFPYIEHIYLQKHSHLFELNMASIKLMVKLLQINVHIYITTEYSTNTEALSLSDTLMPYPQVFEYKHGFTPGCCILDLLLCAGPESILYL